MTRLHRYLLPVLVAGLASAAATVSGPVAGYVAASGPAQLRTIFGVPGAFQLGDPLPLPDGVTEVRLAPGQNFALVERAGSAPGVLYLAGGAVDHLSPIADAMPSADWVAFSPAAGSALLYSTAAGRLQVFNGLPDAPRLVLDLDASTLLELPAMGAVSDDGSLVLVASPSALYRVSASGSQVLLSAGSIASVAVLRNGIDAALADSTTGSVHLVRNAASTPEAHVLASGLDGISAIFPSSDGQSLFASRTAAQAISSIDLVSGTVNSFASSVSPLGLLPLRNRDTFLISAKRHEPGWVFYQDGAAGRVVFIPASEPVRPESSIRGGVR